MPRKRDKRNPTTVQKALKGMKKKVEQKKTLIEKLPSGEVKVTTETGETAILKEDRWTTNDAETTEEKRFFQPLDGSPNRRELTKKEAIAAGHYWAD